MNKSRNIFSLFISLYLIGIFSTAAHAVTQNDKFNAADGASTDWFGTTVAVSGTTVLVGAVQDDDGATNTGSAYIFDCSNLPCRQTNKLTASDAAAGDNFAWSVAISGTTAVIGAIGDDDAGSSSGSAYVFDCSSLPCRQTSKLTASDAAAGDIFGFAVAISGTTVVIGAHGNDDAGSDSGSAYYFDLLTCGAACTQVSKLTAFDAAANDNFSFAVAVSGSTAVIGARFDDDAGSDSGSAYYFDLLTCGAACTQVSKLTATDAAANDQFGISVAISGATAVIGANFDDDTQTSSGSAYYFDLSSCGATCTQKGKLKASDPVFDNQFGISVSISGNTALVGAFGGFNHANLNAGSAYYFYLSNCGAACTESGKLTASDGATGDRFGYSVSVSGTTGVVGSIGDDDLGGDSGSAYLFKIAVHNPDTDGDGVLDASDNCPAIANTDQADNDSDSVGDVCDDDDDNDYVNDIADNCPTTLGGNADQTDSDDDGAGDICDSDLDGDGVANAVDNCPANPNAGQENNDGDLLGDVCDNDDDNDSVLDNTDNCPFTDNVDQADQDGDNIGDVCDADVDGDGTDNDLDNCPLISNAGQDDVDGDLMGDACDADDDNDGVLDGDDNCQATFNPDQTNTDGTGGGDACDEDDDDDGVLDGGDNCPFVSNAAQSDFDNDSFGDACDNDVDNDGVENGSDLCGFTPLGEVIDPALGCTVAELCPCDGPRGTTDNWRNHGKYVSCVAKTSKSFVEQGLITDGERSDMVSAAGQSNCGKQ